MQFITCTEAAHAGAILDILNDAIAHTTALYDYAPRQPESMAAWFAHKRHAGYPVLGAVDSSGALLGFATYGAFRDWPAYKYSVEHSVYVHRDHRGAGVGRALMQRLIEHATEQDYHLMIGGVDAGNAGSVALHERLGFRHAGTIRQVGFKFGRWLDLAFYQLTLPTPHEPVDG